MFQARKAQTWRRAIRSRKAHRWIPLVLVAGWLWLPGLGAEGDWDAPVKKWGKGPVSYLLTEDEEKRAHDRIQELTDKHIKGIDEHLSSKEEEIMKV